MKTARAILLCLTFAAPALAADMAAPAASAPADRRPGVQVPGMQIPGMQIIGFISPMQGMGICQDGASHLIHSTTGDYRLKAASPEAAKALAKFANGKERVAISGHRVQGPECIYFSVESVTPMARQ